MNMTKSFNEKLTELLKKDLRFVDEESGELIRSEIVNEALKIDKKLIESLLSDKEIKDKFFTEIKSHWVFEINKFVDYIQDKNFLSDSYTKFKNKIGLNIDGKFLNERKEVSLVWPFKDCILEGGMTKEDQKKDEIFFNEILAQDEIDRLLDPKVLTGFKRYTAKGEEKVIDFKRDKDGTIKDNLIIKGNNLLALHSLKKEFQGKIKLIYIDPPYNTGGSAETFTYNNNFDHSTWLTFMKNRLEVAKDFLREDGIFVLAIDDVELFYIGVLLDEVFGRNNKIGTISIRHHPRGRTQSKFISAVNEYALFYAKDISKVKENFCFESNNEEEIESFIRSREDATPETRPLLYYPIYYNPETKEISLENKGKAFIKILPANRNGDRTWKLIKESFLEELKEGNIFVKRVGEEYLVYRKIIRENTNKAKSMWTDAKYDANHHGTELLKKLFEGEKLFTFPKSLYTIIDIIKLTTKREDIVMDFFAGSGTTGHAVLELNKEHEGNRQFILIEQLDSHMNVILKRIKKVMEIDSKNKDLGDLATKQHFVYSELMKFNEEAMEKIQEAKNTEGLLKIWKEMCDHYFLNFDVEIKKFNDAQDEFKKLSLEKQKKLLCEMLNKNQLYVNLSEINDSQFKVSKEDKELNKKFYK